MSVLPRKETIRVMNIAFIVSWGIFFMSFITIVSMGFKDGSMVVTLLGFYLWFITMYSIVWVSIHIINNTCQ
jgi:hypothetical protein